PASEQELTQRPCGNGQNRAEQDRGGERSQYRQYSNKQTCEQQKQNDALEKLRGADRGDGRRLLVQQWDSIRHRSPLWIGHGARRHAEMEAITPGRLWSRNGALSRRPSTAVHVSRPL